MVCPRCGAEVKDEAASFCSRCAAPLGTTEGEATQRLRAADEDPRAQTGDLERDEMKDAEPKRAAVAGEAADAVEDFVVATRRSLVVGGWVEATAAAGLAFLALLVVGAVLLVAAKISTPRLLADAAPGEVVAALVILGLASLGVPLRVTDVTLSVLPLGALAGAGAAIGWAARSTLGDDEIETPRRVRRAVKMAVPFALIAWLAALAFRIGDGRREIFAGAIASLVLAGVWGTAFAAVGAIGARRLRAYASKPVSALSVAARAGLAGAGAALAAAGALALLALLLWLIVGLAAGAVPRNFSVPDVVAAFVYIVAFLPNLLVAIVSLGLGASIDAGLGQALLAGARPLERSFSIFDWGGGARPPGIVLLPLIPLAACLLGGFIARRTAPSDASLTRSLLWLAAGFAITMFLLAALSHAALGAGIAAPRGVAWLAPDPLPVLALAAAWSAGAGWVGWRIGDNRRVEAS